MQPFALATPVSYADAAAVLADKRFALPVLKAGGMDVLDHLKEGLFAPDLLVDVRRPRATAADAPVAMVTPRAPGGSAAESQPRLRIAAWATLSDIAGSSDARRHAPAVAQAVESAATPHVRNVATAAGNLLQRPRCWYYRNQVFNCLKKGGDRCYAVAGENKFHAVFGPGPCHIVHPSNLAVPLLLADAVLHLTGSPRAELRMADLYHTPDGGVRDEHNLAPNEVITAISLNPIPSSGFYAVKEKASFDWPLVMAAVSVSLDGDRIIAARVCAGAVAPVPWPLPRVAEALVGVLVTDTDAIARVSAVAAEGATPMSGNAYKLKLLPVAVRRALVRAVRRAKEVPA